MNITSIVLGPKYADAQGMLASLARENYHVGEALANCDPKLIARADPMALSGLDAAVKSGGSLTFEAAFSGMLLVLAATNNPIREALFPETSFPEAVAKGVGFLQLMAVKEALRNLTPEEVAGMVAAGTLDLVFRPHIPQVTETCGMGGDRGWGTRDVKTISASTLGALVLASLDIPTFKHGSYGNTTQVGSTDVPINFGANIYQHTAAEILGLFEETGFWYSDAHSVKTLHHLSHLLMVETVNHIIGPMTVPIAKKTRLFKTMGVNDKIPPWTAAEAYTILHQRGFINLGGAAIICGLDTVPLPDDYPLTSGYVARHTFLDEVSPLATVVSLAVEDRFLGTFVISDRDFEALSLRENSLKVPNTIPDLMRADELALRGRDSILAQYLARNAALGLLISEGIDEKAPFEGLPGCYQRCLEAIKSGAAFQTLVNYVGASGGTLRSWL